MINLGQPISNDEYEEEEGYDYQDDLDEGDDEADQGIYDEEQVPVNNI